VLVRVVAPADGTQDFRSENGLYSLIQAQFDAVAGNEGTDGNCDADQSDLSSDYAIERPAKRRRISPQGASAVFPNLFPNRRPSDKQRAREAVSSGKTTETEGDTIEVATPDSPAQTPSSSPTRAERGSGPFDEQGDVVMGDNDSQEHAPGPPAELTDTDRVDLPRVRKTTPASRATLTPLLSPRLSSGNSEPDEVDLIPVPLVQQSHFVSSPPSLTIGPGAIPTDVEPTHTIVSSPLSSPPPYLSDPFQEYSSSPSSQSSSQEDRSSESRNEDSTPSTPLLTSQTSFASTSSRTSLPNLKGKDLFDAQIWSCPIRTSVFYTFATTLRQKARSAEPTSSHHFVSILRDSRKLVRCYTQNIDQLEERVGLTTSLELGPGSRYRFSARAGRASGGTSKSSAKEPENTFESQAKADSQPDSSSQEEETEGGAPLGEESQSQGGSQDSTAAAEGDSEPPTSGTTITTPTPPNNSPRLGPNRGVECVFLHGSLAQLRCFVCARVAPWDDETRLTDTMAGRQPLCPHCAGATAARQERGKRALGVGKLRPDIVLYGEEHPNAHLVGPIVQHDLSLGPDMLLIMGTSLRVHGLKALVKEFAKAVHDRGGKVVFVNFTKPPESVWADIIDFWVQWDCDSWVEDLRTRRPALFLPPGAAPPETEKTKSAKSSRKSGETAKRGSGTKIATSKPKGVCEPAKLVASPEADSAPTKEEERANDTAKALEEKTATKSPETKVPKPRRTKVKRVLRYNPDAKRPNAVRDDKVNGAYLVRKITFDLHRLTGTSAPSRPKSAPVTPTTKPKVKRARKSAPAALQSVQELAGEKAEAPQVEEVVKPAVETPAPEKDDSISAAVKSRKRKRTVTWKKIHGVETPIALEDQAGPDQALPGPARLLSLSRPRSPEPLPPRLPKLENPPKVSPNKLQPLEPPTVGLFSNPFFLSDPLYRHFGYSSPPRRYVRDERGAYSPTMQLRREEQEAVTALSSLSGRFI